MTNATNTQPGPPERVFLTYGDGTPIEPDEAMNFELDGILWSREQQTEIDVEYVRRDTFDAVVAERDALLMKLANNITESK